MKHSFQIISQNRTLDVTEEVFNMVYSQLHDFGKNWYLNTRIYPERKLTEHIININSNN